MCVCTHPKTPQFYSSKLKHIPNILSHMNFWNTQLLIQAAHDKMFSDVKGLFLEQ